METKLFIGVDYLNECEDRSNMEIFDNIEDVLEFGKTVKEPQYFLVDLNTNYVFKEEDGVWNYDDVAQLIEDRIDIKL